MDATYFTALQEALFEVFTPILRIWLILLAAGGGISVIGAVVLAAASRFSSR